MNRCWLLYSDDVPVPTGTEIDYWVYDDAINEFHELCHTYPFASIILYEVIDYDEPTEKRKMIREQPASW